MDLIDELNNNNLNNKLELLNNLNENGETKLQQQKENEPTLEMNENNNNNNQQQQQQSEVEQPQQQDNQQLDNQQQEQQGDEDEREDVVDDIKEIEALTKEELIESVIEIRNEYYNQKYKYKKTKDKLVEREKQLAFQRNLLSEREDLLLQLQWEPSQDEQYLNLDNENVADRRRMRALIDQMRLMEKGIFDRDAKIKEMEKLVEQLTLAQIGRPNNNSSNNLSDVTSNYPDEASTSFNNNNSNNNNNSGNGSRPSTPRRAIPKFIKRLSEYSLSFKSNRNLLNDDDEFVDVNLHQNHHHHHHHHRSGSNNSNSERTEHPHQNTPKSKPSPSFWNRSTSMLSLLKWSSDDASSTTDTASVTK